MQRIEGSPKGQQLQKKFKRHLIIYVINDLLFHVWSSHFAHSISFFGRFENCLENSLKMV